MSLHDQLADMLDFSEPGYLREKHPLAGYDRYNGMSKRVATFIGQLDEPSRQSVYEMAAERSNQFLAEHKAEIAELPVGDLLTERVSWWLQTGAGEFGIKQFLAVQMTESELQLHAYLVHPEEMDVVLRAALGPAYETLFAPQDDPAI